MTLPKITISLGNGGLQQTSQVADGVAGLILSGAAVVDKVQLDTPYLLTKLQDAVDLGIASTGSNAFAYKAIAQFYEMTGDGAQLYIMLSAQTIDALVLKTNADYAVKLLNYAEGAIRILGVSVEKPGAPTITNGLYENVHTAVTNAQALATEFAGKYKPLRVVIDGIAYSGTPADLTDYTTTTNNRVAVLLSGENQGGNADVGALIGLLSTLPVQRKVSRVRNGAVVGVSAAYFTDDTLVEDAESDWEAIHAKAYIFHKMHAGRSGYFFSSDISCTASDDDYNTISRGRTIDKALTIVYDVLLDELGEEIEINSDGTIPAAVIKSYQQNIENAINLQMTSNGEISDVQILIDPAQNVLSNNTIDVSVRILPVGYSDYIDVDLGYTIQTVE